MLSAYFLTALGALVWLLMRRLVDWCEARADSRLICCLARNSEEFLAHFTLVAAAFALASIFLLIGIGSGISTAVFLGPIEGFLVQAERLIETVGLSARSASAILIGVYLLQLLRLPEDLELPRFPSALRFIRKPRPGIRSVMHTGVYLIVLLAASTVFFTTQAGALTAVVSARLSEISRVADLHQSQKQGQHAADIETTDMSAEPVAQASIEQPLKQTQTPEVPSREKVADRPPVFRGEAAVDPGKQNLQRLAAFRVKALDGLKGVKLARGKAPDAAAAGRGTRSARSSSYRHNPRFHPGYYPQGYGRAEPVARQRMHPGYPGARMYYPQKQTASRRVSIETLDAEKLIEAVHADLQGMPDPARQERAIAAAVELFGVSASTDPEFLGKVEKFAEQYLPTEGATAAIIAKKKTADSPATSVSAPAVPTTYRYPRPPVLLYPWQVQGQRPAVVRPE